MIQQWFNFITRSYATAEHLQDKQILTLRFTFRQLSHLVQNNPHI